MQDARTLIEACKNGSSRAQYDLFQLTGPKMMALCRRYCKNNDDAHDALQEGFIKVFKSLDKYRGDSAPETWMGRIFINSAIDQYKKSIKYNQLFDNWENSNSLEEAEEAYEDNNFPCTPEQIIAILDKMPQGYRLIFNLYCLEGFTHKKIGEELGISEGTSKSQYSRARKFIYDALQKPINSIG